MASSSVSLIDQVLSIAQTALIIVIALFLVGVFVYFSIKLYFWYLRFKNRTRSLKDKTFFKIQINEDNEIEPAAGEQM